jgi:hypothetical protein
MLIQNLKAGSAVFQRVWRHPELIGVKGVEGSGRAQFPDFSAHRRLPVSQDQKRKSFGQAGEHIAHIPDARTWESNGMDGAADPAKRFDVFLSVPGARETNQRYFMSPLRKRPQDIIGAYLRPGIERKWQKLR